MKNNNSKSMKRLIGYLFKHNKLSMTLVIISIFFSAIASSASGIFIYYLLNNVVAPAIQNGFASVAATLTGLIIAMAVVYGLGVLASWAYSFIIAKVGQRTLNLLRKEMFSKMEELPISYFDKNKHGDIMSYYTNDIDSIRQFFSQSLVQIINTIFTLIILTVFMLYYSVTLTAVVYLCAIIMIIIIKTIGGKSSRYFVKQQTSTAKFEGYVTEMMNGEKVIKAYNHENEAIASFGKLNSQVEEDSSTANVYGNSIMPILGSIGNYLYVLIAIIGGIMTMVPSFQNLSLTGFGAMSAAIIVSFLSMSRQFGQSIAQVSQQTSMCAMAFAGADRVFALIDENKEIDEGKVTLVSVAKSSDGSLIESPDATGHWAWKKEDGSLTELRGNIVFKDVDFSYEPNHIVLHDLCLDGDPGKKIAFVGATGAGKTTITNLINRFYDIQKGTITYDDIPIKSIKKSSLRNSVTVVLQDTNLFSGTVRDNIRYGKLEASDEEVDNAAKTANAYDFIKKLPNGFDTELSNNAASLSQGQRQLISIARAAIANTPVLILDEATSSIDTRTEQMVQKGTEKIMDGRTTFVIAHRLSTVQNSDEIIVLDHGRIIEKGNHSSLMKERGTYYQLYTGAFELE
jgi:ATP-binding cassette subfamily B multidrug efflux pump